MKCCECGNKHRPIHWLAGWLHGAKIIIARYPVCDLSDDSRLKLACVKAEYEAAYNCLYAQIVGGGE